ncbi:hypothetical protein A2U01_0101905, partial [Trifolium medium]|nr:hypothetical protein [Trifolium medium]
MRWWGLDLGASVEEAPFCLGAGSPSWASCFDGLSFSFLVCGFLVLEVRVLEFRVL